MSWLKQLSRGIWVPTDTRRLRRARIGVERLYDRIVPAAVPVVSITAEPEPLLGTNSVPASVTFTNPSAGGATNPGFAPWAYVVIPNVSADGNANHGVSFDSGVTPNYLGAPVAFQPSTVPVSGSVTGPAFALGPAGSPIVLTGLTQDDQVVFFQLPFGSFAVDQPGGTINFAIDVSNAATVGAALTLTGAGGFSFGNNALNNPTTDPPLVGATDTATVTPRLFEVTKTYLGPEQETATGPNFTRQYAVEVTVAPGQTISSFTVSDLLPDNMQFVSLDLAAANGGITTGNNAAGLTAGPGGTLDVTFNQVVGTGGPTDVRVLFSFYIPELAAGGSEVLPLNTGAFASVINNASGNGTWTNPFDPTEATNVPVTDTADPNTITAKSIATQKGVAVVGGGPVRQGSVLEYTIEFQVSDYFAFNQLNIGDLLPDGVRFDGTFVPTLTINQHADATADTGSSATAGFDAANYLSPLVTTFNPDGTQTLNFAVSNELIFRGQSGAMIGGNIPVGGTAGPNPPDAFNAPLFSPGTTGVIVFRAVVQPEYDVLTSPEGNPDVKQGDSLNNVVPNATGPNVTTQPGGQVLNFTNLSPTGTFQADNTAAAVTLETGLFAKSVYAVNGNTVVASPFQVQAGDTVTYRLTYVLPTSTAENFVLTDFLPLPVFDATSVTTFDGLAPTNVAAPAAGRAHFGPGIASLPAGFIVPGGAVDYTTIFPTPANAPGITSNAGTNTVVFAFPTNLEDPLQRTSVVDVLFTVTVLGERFGDGLFLTNQANAREGNTTADVSTADAIVQIQLTEPVVPQIRKGVVSTNNAGNVFSPATVGPVAFAAPGNVAAPFNPVINSTNLAANPINSNASNLFAGNLVKFAVVVENVGRSVNGMFNVQISDTLPAGFILPTSGPGLNLQVFNGAGSALPFTPVNGADTNPFFQSGIQLADPSATQGSLTAGRDASGNVINTGTNIAIITYDLQIQPNNAAPDSVHPTEQLTNTATLFNFTAVPGGPNYLPSPLTDPAVVTITPPQLAKSIVATSEASTAQASNVLADGTVGEIVRYRLVVQLPASRSPSFQIVDQLPAGQSYLGNATAAFVSSSGAALFSSTLVGADYTIAGTTVVSPNPAATVVGTGTGASGATVTFALGDVTNDDMNTAVPEYVIVEFNALVRNVAPASTAGRNQVNNFIALANTGSGVNQIGPRSNNTTVRIVEPRVATDKTVSPGTADINDPVTYTITYNSNGGTTAFIPRFLDLVPASITVSSVTASASGGVVGLVNNSVGNQVDISATVMPVGGVVTVTINGVVASAIVGVPILNTANATWSSLPGGTGTVGGTNTTGQVTPGTDGAVDGARNGNTSATGGAANVYNTSDTVPLNVTPPIPAKSLVSTSEASTSGNSVAVGEVVRYQLAVRVPQGLSPNLQIVDALPAGMRFLGNTRIAFVSATGTDLSSSDPAINTLPGLSIAGTSPNVTPTAVFPTDAAHIAGGTGGGVAVTFTLGDITNADTVAADDTFIVIHFNALVDNVSPNITGAIDTNTFTVRVSGAQVGLPSNPVDVVVVEPSITDTTKSVLTTGRDPGDNVTYRITYSNTGVATAFDVRLLDVMPGTLTLNPTSVVVRRNGVVIGSGFTNNSAGNALDVVLAQVAVSGTIQIDYTARINNAVPAGATIVNTADLTFTSLSGPNGTVVNPTGQSTPGTSGALTGERNGSGGLNNYIDGSQQLITLNTNALNGVVYQDLNRNGTLDPGEPPIPGTIVTLTGTNVVGDPVTRTTTTDGTGRYTFLDLIPSNSNGYTITETQPAGFLNGKTTTPYQNFTGVIGSGSHVGRTVQYTDTYTRVIIGRGSNLVGTGYNFGEVVLTNVVPGPIVTPGGTAVLFCNGTVTEISVPTLNPLDLVEVTLMVTPGTGTIHLTGVTGLTFTAGSNGSSMMTFRGQANYVNTALSRMRYQPSTTFSGTTLLTMTSQGLNSAGLPLPGVTDTDSVAITVQPRNHAPTVQVPAAQATDQNTPLVFSTANGNPITLGDPDVDPSVQVFQLTLTASRGTATLATTAGLTSLTGNGTTTVTVRGTLNTLNAAIDGLTFTPTSSGTGSLVATLNDLANTVGPALQTGRSVSISITRMNQPPVISGPASATRSGGSVLFTGATLISVADVDAGTGIMEITLNVTGGTLMLGSITGLTAVSGNGTGSITIRGRLSYLNTALRGMRYTGGVTTLTVTANDLGNTGGGALTDTLNVAIL